MINKVELRKSTDYDNWYCQWVTIRLNDEWALFKFVMGNAVKVVNAEPLYALNRTLTTRPRTAQESEKPVSISGDLLIVWSIDGVTGTKAKVTNFNGQSTGIRWSDAGQFSNEQKYEATAFTTCSFIFEDHFYFIGSV